MQQENMGEPSGPGSRASTEPAPQSPPPASIPLARTSDGKLVGLWDRGTGRFMGHVVKVNGDGTIVYQDYRSRAKTPRYILARAARSELRTA